MFDFSEKSRGRSCPQPFNYTWDWFFIFKNLHIKSLCKSHLLTEFFLVVALDVFLFWLVFPLSPKAVENKEERISQSSTIILIRSYKSIDKLTCTFLLLNMCDTKSKAPSLFPVSWRFPHIAEDFQRRSGDVLTYTVKFKCS